MASEQPVMCTVCGEFYRRSDEEAHMNLHADPHTLAPRTNPNDVGRIQLAKVLNEEDEQDSTDIALRSLLPDQIPQPEKEKRNIGAPADDENGLRNDTGSGAGAHRISEALFRQMQQGNRLDLTSKLALGSLSKDELNKLDIEQQVQIGQIRHTVPKKEILKFQNEPVVSKPLKDLGGCDKKVINKPVDYVKQPQENGNESGYKIVSDVSSKPSGQEKPLILVPVNRKTQDPNNYYPADTVANQKEGKRPPRNEYLEQSSSKVGRQYTKTYHEEKQPMAGSNQRPNHVHGLHPHECPDCHGFYCPTCHATIPPQYRPFWDEGESPQVVEFYKKRIRQEQERERKQRGDCKYCNQVRQEQQKKQHQH